MKGVCLFLATQLGRGLAVSGKGAPFNLLKKIANFKTSRSKEQRLNGLPGWLVQQNANGKIQSWHFCQQVASKQFVAGGLPILS